MYAAPPMPPAKPSKKPSASPREDILASAREKQALPADPFSREQMRAMGLRIGIPTLIVWAIAFAIPGWIPKAVVGVLTLALVGVVVWALRYAQKSRKVAEILKTADTPEARKEAIAKLESEHKDATEAILARAQLELQDDPRKALATLETVKLDRVMAPIADQTRGQRAMIHLLLGETDEARVLVDNIELSRHKEPKTVATLASIVAEAWARTGQAKKALETLSTFDLADEVYADIKPQLLRSKAFAQAWTNDTKAMKGTLRQLAGINIQYLTGFVTKKKMPGGVAPKGVHPLLEKEAFDMVMKSGAVQRKMEMRRS
jgi:hypothetical protein